MPSTVGKLLFANAVLCCCCYVDVVHAAKKWVDVICSSLRNLIVVTSLQQHNLSRSIIPSPFFFNAGGEVCFLEDAEAKLSLLYGRPVKLDAGFVRRKEQVPWRAFLGRWLNNLKHLYIQQQLPEDTLTIIRMLRATRPDSIEEIRDEVQ